LGAIQTRCQTLSVIMSSATASQIPLMMQQVKQPASQKRKLSVLGLAQQQSSAPLGRGKA
jgi:hypothetical protein